MDWLKKQPKRQELFDGEKIPCQLLFHSTLVNEISKYLGGPENCAGTFFTYELNRSDLPPCQRPPTPWSIFKVY
ncbi:hypothetical protein AOG2_15480 [Geobacter sp. AOG2]|nr:hypothetical protein AOG2_15480 [Geobacter sp. AOG2]